MGRERVIAVFFYEGDVRRDYRLRVVFYEAKYFVFGWRVKVIKKDVFDVFSFFTVGYKEVFVIFGIYSRVVLGIRGTEIDVGVSV